MDDVIPCLKKEMKMISYSAMMRSPEQEHKLNLRKAGVKGFNAGLLLASTKIQRNQRNIKEICASYDDGDKSCLTEEVVFISEDCDVCRWLRGLVGSVWTRIV